jgi:phytoene dehydrogenase-like protein
VSVPDAVVIGSGPNGLVAANVLADAGWSVLVLEAQDEPGGAVRSDREVHPDYVHDTFSSFYPLAAASPTIRELGLERFGLEWAHAPAVAGTPFATGEWALLHASAEETAAGLEARTPGDGEAWLRLCADWEEIGDHVLGSLLTPFPPVRHGVAALARLHRVGGLAFAQMMVSPLRTVAEGRLGGRPGQMLLAGNAAHADIPVDAPGSAAMAWILAMVGQNLGFPVPRGGAGMLTRALVDRLAERGGEVRLGARATSVVVRDRRAAAVRTQDGDVVTAGRAVLADVPAPSLYGGLVDAGHLPSRLMSKMERFEWDPGTIKVDWALDGPVPWASAPEKAPGTIHVAESIDEIAVTGTQIASGAVPARPFLLVGQMAAADPTRVPEGGEALWSYTHVPQRTTSDAGGGGIRGVWDRSDAERMADRMQARLEAYAPGFTSRVVARRVLGPRELEERNESLVGGALNGGTAGLHQQLVFRPVPGLGRSETPIRGLYLASASAHPGGGVHGACGANAARAALAHHRARSALGLRRTLPVPPKENRP